MIGCFPDLHPDELLYSACARYGERVTYPNRCDVVEELFGSRSTVAVIELPNKLAYLVERLPPGHLYTTDMLIDRYTLYPFYAPFLPTEAAQFIREEMHRTGHNRIQMYAGFPTNAIRPPDRLRFCPSCLREDRELYGEAYWHRVHQITGVEACPSHAVFLEVSTALSNDRSNPYIFHSAEQSARDAPPRPLNPEDYQHSVLLKLARDAAWLLNWSGPHPGLEDLRERYFDLLLQQGYAFHNGRLRANKLHDAFVSFYPPELLQSLQCPVRQKGVSWLQRLVIKICAGSFRHPLRHLLLMTFLGRTAEQIFTQFKAARPFGGGPWPCLNPAADHFRQSVVIECRVVGKSDGNEGQRPHGTFTCGCGFVYTRLGPDITEEDRFRKQHVLAFGPVWDARLRELWSSSATISEIAIQFKTDGSNIRRLAQRRGLPSSRSNHHTVPTVVSQSGQIYVEVRGSKWSLETRRQRWLDHLDAHPSASRSVLTKSGEYILKWLKVNDGEWLEAHLPPKRTPPPPPRRVDYEARDINLAEKIRRAALRIS